jgi:hypothetical protein
VKVEGRCVAWKVHGHLASARRQTPRGELLVEMSLDPPPAIRAGEHVRRVSPADALRDRLASLACPACAADDREEADAHVASSVCSSPEPARWYEWEQDCLRAAERSGESGWDAGADSGHDVARCAFSEFTTEGMRLADIDDARDYDEMLGRVQAAEGAARTRLRAFEAQIARTRRIFVRDGQSGEGPCASWNVRQDPGSPSGWVSREQKLDDGTRELAEFRFAARLDAVELTGWMSTVLPTSREDAVGVGHPGSPCTRVTGLVDVSAARIKFDDQVWYLSEAACRLDLKKLDPDANGFGPTCDARGR